MLESFHKCKISFRISLQTYLHFPAICSPKPEREKVSVFFSSWSLFHLSSSSRDVAGNCNIGVSLHFSFSMLKYFSLLFAVYLTSDHVHVVIQGDAPGKCPFDSFVTIVCYVFLVNPPLSQRFKRVIFTHNCCCSIPTLHLYLVKWHLNTTIQDDCNGVDHDTR